MIRLMVFIAFMAIVAAFGSYIALQNIELFTEWLKKSLEIKAEISQKDETFYYLLLVLVSFITGAIIFQVFYSTVFGPRDISNSKTKAGAAFQRYNEKMLSLQGRLDESEKNLAETYSELMIKKDDLESGLILRKFGKEIEPVLEMLLDSARDIRESADSQKGFLAELKKAPLDSTLGRQVPLTQGNSALIIKMNSELKKLRKDAFSEDEDFIALLIDLVDEVSLKNSTGFSSEAVFLAKLVADLAEGSGCLSAGNLLDVLSDIEFA